MIVFHFLMKRDENPFFTRKVCVRLKRYEQISLVRSNQEQNPPSESFFFSIFFKVALRIMKQAILEAEETVLVILKLEEAVN